MRPGPPTATHRKKWLAAIIILIIAVSIFAFVRQRSTKTPNSEPTSGNAKQPQQAAAINGSLVDATVARQKPIAVVVENHPDARPQSGLSQADIVYETLAEGGITRYLAIFQTQNVANIGPVRSARVYFADIADEWQAVFAHVGGNSDALTNIRNGVYKNIDDTDQFFNDTYFHRIAAKTAPHNVYTSVDKLRQLEAAHQDSNQTDYSVWRFKDDSPASPATATRISIPFSTASYNVSYIYDIAANGYKRFLAGKADRDANNNQQIIAKNIIIQFADDFATQTDTVGSISFTLTGSGKAKLFIDGDVIVGTWKKQSGVTRYYDGGDKEIALNRGQTWVEIVPTSLVPAVTATSAIN